MNKCLLFSLLFLSLNTWAQGVRFGFNVGQADAELNVSELAEDSAFSEAGGESLLVASYIGYQVCLCLITLCILTTSTQVPTRSVLIFNSNLSK